MSDPNNNDDSSSSEDDPLMNDDISFDEEETPLDDLDVWNPEDPSYLPPTEDTHKGALQLCLEQDIAATDHRSYVYMLVLSVFPDWNVARKTPYYENETKEMKDKKPREYQSLKFGKRLLVQEIRRRDATLGRNAKNKTISALFDELVPLTDPRDVLYLKYRERELRRTIRAFLQKRSEFDRQKEAAAAQDGEDDSHRVPAAQVAAQRQQQPNVRNGTLANSRTPPTTTGRTTTAATAAQSRLATTPQPASHRTASSTTAPDRNAVLLNNHLERLLVEVSQMSQAVTRMADTIMVWHQESRLVEDEDVRKELASLKKERRELQMVWARESDPAVKEALNAMLEEMKQEIDELSKNPKKRPRVEE